MKINIDFMGLLAGLRIASALLITNSVLVYAGAIDGSLHDADVIATKVFLIGVIGVICTSLQRSES